MQRTYAALLLFLAATAATFLLPLHAWDVATTIWLQRVAPAPDVPASAFVFLGDAEVVIPATVVAGLLLWPHHRAQSVTALWLAGGLVVVSGIAVCLKFVLPHPGPPPEFQRGVVRFGLGVPQPFSFPSGHTTRTTFIASTVLRRLPIAAVVLVVAMMAALVYLGDHWMSDVLGGLCLGWACAEIAGGTRGKLTG